MNQFPEHKVSEVARMLRVDRRTVYSWIHSGRLPAFRVGNEYRIAQTDLERMVNG